MAALLPTSFAMFVVILAQSAAPPPRLCDALRRGFQREHRPGRSGPGQYWRRPVRHLRRQRQSNQDANRRRRRWPQPTVPAGDGGNGGADPALSYRSADAYLPEAALSAIVFLIGWLDRRRWDAEGFRSKARGVLVGTDHRVDGRDHRCRTGYTARHRVVAHRSYPVRLSTEERGACAWRIGRWQPEPVVKAGSAAPGLVIYRFTHSIYYANCRQLADEIAFLADTVEPLLRWLCLDA